MPSSRRPIKRIPFKPGTKGCLTSALRSPEALQEVAPRLMRPVALLDGMKVLHAMTAADMSVWQLFASKAQEQGLKSEVHHVELAQVQALLGKHARPSRVKTALRRLRLVAVKLDAEIDEVNEIGEIETVHETGELPYLTASLRAAEGAPTMVRFTIPEQIRRLLMAPGKYFHLELAALPLMRSRYSVSLYQALVAKMPVQKSGTPWRQETHEIRMSPVEVAKAIGYTTANKVFDFGAFNRGVLITAQRDLKHVRRFRTEIETVRSSGRGREVQQVIFRLTTTAPNWRELPSTRFSSRHLKKAVHPDAPARQVDPAVFVRAATHLGICKPFRNSLGMADGEDDKLVPGIGLSMLRCAWLMALTEADLGKPLAPGFRGRAYRGDRLLKALASKNPSDVCWDFLVEETERPAMFLHSEKLHMKLGAYAEKARYSRYMATKGKEPLSVADLVPADLLEKVLYRGPDVEPEIEAAPSPEVPVAAMDLISDSDLHALFGEAGYPDALGKGSPLINALCTKFSQAIGERCGPSAQAAFDKATQVSPGRSRHDRVSILCFVETMVARRGLIGYLEQIFEDLDIDDLPVYVDRFLDRMDPKAASYRRYAARQRLKPNPPPQKKIGAIDIIMQRSVMRFTAQEHDARVAAGSAEAVLSVENRALAARIAAVKSSLSVHRVADADDATSVRFLFRHNGSTQQVKQVKLECGYRLTADNISALRGMDGVGEIREKC